MLQIDRPKIWSIGLLHMGQSFPGALAAVALPALFRENGLPLEMFWLFALPLIPGWFRWLIAIVIDNHGSEQFGYRKSWILPCTLIGTALYLSISFVDPTPTYLWLIICLLVVKSVIMTAQDVAVDGLAAESFNDAERPMGAAIIVFLMFMGTVAAQGMVAAVPHIGWQLVMVVAAFLLFMVALPTLLRNEAPAPKAARERRQALESASVIEFVLRRESRFIMPLLLAIGFSSNLMRAMLPVYLVDLGLSLTQIGLIFGFAVVIGTSLATFLIPILSRRMTRTKLSSWVVAGYVPCCLLFLAMNLKDLPTTLIALALAYVMFISTSIWMLVTEARLEWSSARQAATDFSSQASFANLGEWAGASVGGFLAAAFGWLWFFNIAWVLSAAAGIAFVLLLTPINQLIGSRDPKTA